MLTTVPPFRCARTYGHTTINNAAEHAVDTLKEHPAVEPVAVCTPWSAHCSMARADRSPSECA